MHARGSIPFVLVLAVATLVAEFPTLGEAASSAPLAVQGKSGYHEDSIFGYRFKPPKDWSNIPVKVDEGWLIAKFLSDRDYHYTEKGGWTYEHKPELMAIAFIEQKTKKDDVEVDEEDDGEKITIRFNQRYEDYQDYLKKTYSGGGYFVAGEEEIELDGVKVTCLDIKVEKLTRTGPKRITSWIYHLKGVDIAMQIEVLENHYTKLKKTIDSAFKSFDEIPRTGELPDEQSTSTSFTWNSRSKLDEMSLSDRNKLLMEQCETQHQNVIDALPEGWEYSKEKACLVITNADMKYGKRLASDAKAVMDWLEENFDYVGPQRYVRAPILRLCKTRDEQYSYSRGGGSGWGGTNLEFVTSLENARDWAGEFSWINGRVATHWFQDRDQELYWALPEWLDHGLTEFINNSKIKGSKLKFRQDDWDRDDLRNAVRNDGVQTVQSLMQMSRTELWEGRDSSFWNSLDEAESFVFFLLDGDGAKNKQFREIIPNYLKNLRQLLDEEKDKVEEKEPGAADTPETEEEEEERFRKRREELRDREKEFLEKVFQRTFAGWSEKDWEKLEKSFLKSIS